MGASFLGRGWRFPIKPDATGRLGYSSAEDNIAHSLKVLLLTALGERVMRPDFGCKVPRLVFAPGSDRVFRLLEESVRAAVRDFEPRVELLDAVAEEDPDEPGRVTVAVSYRVRATNTPFNLVFPFHLGPAGGPAGGAP